MDIINGNEYYPKSALTNGQKRDILEQSIENGLPMVKIKMNLVKIINILKILSIINMFSELEI